MDGEFWGLGGVTDGELQSELLRLLSTGAQTDARVIAHLAAVEDRRLHLKAACSSMFDYCCARLGLSESEAFHRLTAARLGRRFPLIFSLIAQRHIHFTGVCLLRDFLTVENHRELLEEARGKTKLQIQELIARHFPRPDVASKIRKLPEARAVIERNVAARVMQCANASADAMPMQGASAATVTDVANAEPARESSAGRVAAGADSFAARAARAVAIEPLSEARYRIQLNASAELKAKLDLAMDLLSHSNPGGDLATVIERGLDLLIERTQNRRFAQTKRPRRTRGVGGKKCANGATEERNDTIEGVASGLAENEILASGPAHESAPEFRTRRRRVPNAMKRQILDRDGLRCTYVSGDGRRCEQTRHTQIHHEQPWARGGGETLENLRLLCAAHNQLLAERDFGRVLVATRVAQRRREAREAREADGGGLAAENGSAIGSESSELTHTQGRDLGG